MSRIINSSDETITATRTYDEFRDRHVVITGGTGALGAALVGLLLERGAFCHVPYLGEVGGLGGLKHSQLDLVPDIDLTHEASVSQFYAGLPQLWSSIHLAGAYKPGALLGTSLADLEQMLLLNAATCFLCSREAVRFMQGKATPGRIVNVAAQAALVPSAGNVAYSVSKAAVVSLTTCVAAEVKGSGILVNAVAPSIMDTPANRRSMPNADYSKWPTTEEVAEAILYLASPRNALTSGVTIPVYGRM